jgi:hypothetical protein
MEIISLIIMVVALLVVFSVDTTQKRSKYLGK